MEYFACILAMPTLHLDFHYDTHRRCILNFVIVAIILSKYRGLKTHNMVFVFTKHVMLLIHLNVEFI